VPPYTMSLGPRSTSVASGILIHPAVWPQQTWTENWGLCPYWGGEVDPHLTNTNSVSGAEATTTPSFILIHPTVWPQYTNVTDRQAGRQTDNGLIAGRTVLQTVTQKTAELIEMPFGLWTRVGSMKHVLHGGTLVNTIEPSVCVGDAALSQITLTTCLYC